MQFVNPAKYIENVWHEDPLVTGLYYTQEVKYEEKYVYFTLEGENVDSTFTMWSPNEVDPARVTTYKPAISVEAKHTKLYFSLWYMFNAIL